MDARGRLSAARFRMLNEELYSTGSEHHLRMFSGGNEEAWFVYHEGYRAQLREWPASPLAAALAWLRAVLRERRRAGGGEGPPAAADEETTTTTKKSAKRKRDEPAGNRGGAAGPRARGRRDAGGDVLVVADFGCGDAELGRTMDTTDNGRRMRGGGVRVHSFDLVAANESVTKVRVRAPSSAEPAASPPGRRRGALGASRRRPRN